MIGRYQGRPFAVASVYCDDNLGYLNKAIASGEITWRIWCDGGPEGPISRRWSVSCYPTVFLIDGAGVIRHKLSGSLGLESTVEAMVEEAEKDARR